MSCAWTLLSHILVTKVLYPTKQSGQGLLFQLIQALFFSFVRVEGLLMVQLRAALDDRRHCWG